MAADPGRSGRRLGAVALAAFVVVVLGLSFGIHRWVTPSVFRDGDGGSFSLTAQPLTKFPLYIGFGFPEGNSSETVTVDSARIHFTENSAGFTATVLICAQRPVKEGQLVVGSALAGEESLSKYCTSVHGIREGTRVYRAKFSGQYFVSVLTPSRAGTAHIDAINIHYSRSAGHLFQRGTQHVAQDITIAAKK